MGNDILDELVTRYPLPEGYQPLGTFSNNTLRVSPPTPAALMSTGTSGATQSNFTFSTWYRGNGDENWSQVVHHNLGFAPRTVIVKERDTVGDWKIFDTTRGNPVAEPEPKRVLTPDDFEVYDEGIRVKSVRSGSGYTNTGSFFDFDFDMFPARVNQSEGYRTTQRSNTVSSYKKVAALIREENDYPERILDFGAGLCQGTTVLRAEFPDAEVHSYEPHPDIDLGICPNFTSSSNVFASSYDFVVCLNVLNVLTPLRRRGALSAIIDKLVPGGIAIVGVRSDTDVDRISRGGWNHAGVESGSVWVRKSALVYSYQKGFQQDELLDYLATDNRVDTVEPIQGLCGRAALIVRK